jgi:DNA-binding response OmpR family regulator
MRAMKSSRQMDGEKRNRLEHLPVRLAFQGEGYQAIGAESGEEALAIFAESPPDVTVLDVGLPGIDGLEVAHRRRANPLL